VYDGQGTIFDTVYLTGQPPADDADVWYRGSTSPIRCAAARTTKLRLVQHVGPAAVGAAAIRLDGGHDVDVRRQSPRASVDTGRRFDRRMCRVVLFAVTY